MYNLSFGFFGVQIAYALQSANISRIFSTLGADPHDLSFFWILPPLMGMVVQPLVGTWSDRTWCKWGRRKPYLYLGALVAVLVMALLPNAGSLNLSIKAAMAFGLVMLMLLDTSINMAMQPFKMMVGDVVNEEQKGEAYSIQSLLCNAGSLVGYLFPYLFTWIGIQSTAPEGVIPDSVIYSFYAGAAILIICVLFTGFNVREMPPQEYAKYHPAKKEEEGEKPGLLKLLINAPKSFWQIGLVQFFSWMAFLYMWTYTHGAIADGVWGIDPNIKANTETAGFQAAGDWVGVLFAVQAIGSVLWAVVLSKFKSLKLGYVVSLLLGAVGFISVFFVMGDGPAAVAAATAGEIPTYPEQYYLFVSFLLIGCAWAAMLSMPFALFTNSLSGGSMGAYLGLFNCTICVPQIIAALLGKPIMAYVVDKSQPLMMVVAGIALLAAALSVGVIRTKKEA